MREPFDDLLRVLVRREDGVENFLYQDSWETGAGQETAT